MRVTSKVIAGIIVCLCLTSCWLPEEFTATLNVDKSKNFQFTYDGTMVFGPALGQIRERGQLSSADEAAMKDTVAGLRKEPGFASLEYIGRGRFRVRYREAGQIQFGKKIFLDLIEFRGDPGGRIRLLGAEIPVENRKQLSAVGLKLDGNLKVTTEFGIAEHNATSTPWFGGLLGAYEWHITLDQAKRPTIVLQP